MAIDISIRPSSPTPIFRQIVDHICAAVVAGKFDGDTPLPSVRALAEHLVVNPNTVARAYAELSRDGVIESRQGRGMFVAGRREIYSREERKRRIERSVTQLINEAFVLGFSSDEIVDAVAARARDLEPKRQSAAKATKNIHRDNR